jgi:hypothetical protein
MQTKSSLLVVKSSFGELIGEARWGKGNATIILKRPFLLMVSGDPSQKSVMFMPVTLGMITNEVVINTYDVLIHGVPLPDVEKVYNEICMSDPTFVSEGQDEVFEAYNSKEMDSLPALNETQLDKEPLQDKVKTLSGKLSLVKND